MTKSLIGRSFQGLSASESIYCVHNSNKFSLLRDIKVVLGGCGAHLTQEKVIFDSLIVWKEQSKSSGGIRGPEYCYNSILINTQDDSQFLRQS